MLPGSHRAAGLVDDAALIRAMLRVEVAWARELGSSISLGDWTPALDPVAVEAAGNPVLPLVSALRERVSSPVHTGLTSQDVLDTALMLLARGVVERVSAELERVAATLDRLADEHRSSVMAGRTLTQHAVPITFGLKAARWLTGVLDSIDELAALTLPVQCGGAAGTLSRAALVVDPIVAASSFARSLGLVWPGLPWHTYRAPITRLGDALVRTCSAVGVIAADVLTLGRPEIAEVREGAVAGRGGSSTMPHKQNPVLSVLVNSAALQAPQLGAQLHLCSARAVDERPDGAWHAEWPALRALLELAVVTASQAAELVEGLEVRADVMARRAGAVAGLLLAERPPAERLAAERLQVERSAAERSAVVRSSAEGSLAERSSAAGSPVEQLPADRTPVEQSPAEQLPVERSQIEQLPTGQLPVEQLSDERSRTEQSPVEQSPVERSLVEQLPVERSRTEQLPVGQTPVEQTPVEQTPVEQLPTEQLPTEQLPTEQLSVEQSHVDRLSAVRSPVEPSSAKPSSAEQSSAEQSSPDRRGETDPATYLGATEQFVDQVLHRNRSRLAPLRGEHEVPTPIVSKGSDKNGD